VEDILEQEIIFENKSDDLFIALVIIVGALLIKKPFSKLLARLFYRPFKRISDSVGPKSFIDLLYKPIGLVFILSSLFIAFDRLQYPSAWDLADENEIGLIMITQRSFAVLYLISITWIMLRLIDYFTLVFIYRAEQTEGTFDDQLVPFFKDGTKILVVVLMVFLILGIVFKLNIASLVAGLGIGGLALALAAKETLENLLGSFTIFLDKPFKIGDQVIVNNFRGKVERIGLRSTRLRTLENSLVTVPNKRMVDAELDNLTERQSFRVFFNLTVTYSTSREKLTQFIDRIKVLLTTEELIEENFSVRFHTFGDSALEIRVDYYVSTPVFDEHLLIREKVNIKIMELAEQIGVDFAFPSRSLYIEKN